MARTGFALKSVRTTHLAPPGVGTRYFGVSGRLWGLAAVALAVVVATNLLDLKIYQFRVRVLDANWQFSWSHDLDTLALAIGVVVTAVGARRHPRHRALWSASAVILALFLLDEVSPLHAEIGHVSKLLYAPILVGLAACVWLLADRTAQRPVALLGLATLLICFGMHVVGLTVLRPIGYMSVPYQLGVGLKEGTELAGLLIVLCALAALARRNELRSGRVPGRVVGRATPR